MLIFSLVHSDGKARAGTLTTERGEIATPVFMPVGTQGTVKAVEPRELEELGSSIVLGNTYHLYLRPGIEVIEKAGGLHEFCGWRHSILTDSGGYQVFSLAALRGITEGGVAFRSHLDGSAHEFTPERVIDIQRSLGSDIMMVLDECTPYPCAEDYAAKSSRMTLRWAERSRRRAEEVPPLYGKRQSLFGILQGGIYPRLREESARMLVAMEFDGYAIGGLSVGEPVEEMYSMTELCTGLLPPDRPRYLMGVGTPENIVEAIARGIDMFDCVLPTRTGRNGLVFTSAGKLNMRNAGYADDFSPVDPDCSCYTCRNFTRAYLRHLFVAKEVMALQLASLHNLSFYCRLVRAAREAILHDRFDSWKVATLDRMTAQAAEQT